MENNVEVKKTPFSMKNNSVFGITFSLGSETRTFNLEDIKSISSHLESWLEWEEEWGYTIGFYKDYSLESIKIDLDEQEKGFGEDDGNEYSIGENFAKYLEISSDSGMWSDNHKASKIISKEWAKEFPEYEKDLTFDSEMSFCYVYTKKREVAEKFSWWSYNKYIKPTIDDILNDIEE